MATNPNINIEDRIAGATPIVVEGPRPLFRELPPAQPFPIRALGPVLQRAAQAISDVIQCPEVCSANSVLSVASLAAQGTADVMLPIGQGKRAPLSLFVLTVLDSGERKSSADSMALKPVRDFEHELAEYEAAERQSYNVKLAAHEVAAKQLTNKHKGDRNALEAALHDLGPAPQPPLISIIAPSSDPTFEGLYRIFQQGRPSIAALCDDAGSFLGGHSFKAEQKQAATANLCRAWDGSKLERIRAGDGVTVLYGRRLATHLMVQTGVSAAFLSDQQFADQGLLARFLISAPEGRMGTRFRDDAEYQKLAYSAALDLDDYNKAIARLLRQPIRWKNEHDRAVGVEFNLLGFAADARSLYVGFVNAIEKELTRNGSLYPVRAFASKLPEHAARIAGVLTLLEDPDADVVTAEMLANGIELGKYYLAEALRLSAVGMVDPALQRAERLRKWLVGRSSPIVGHSQVYQFGPAEIRDAKTARDTMKVLEDHHWVMSLPDGADIDGKHHRVAWRVVKC